MDQNQSFMKNIYSIKWKADNNGDGMCKERYCCENKKKEGYY